MIRVLRYPPPSACELCALLCEPFASRAGWYCWSCLPPEDKVDENGNSVPEPELDAQDRADLQAIRERLGPEAVRCGVCHERRGPSELWAANGQWVCRECAARAAA